MRFLVDAQLPQRLARALREMGHEAVHTLDLPSGNETTDSELARYADANDAVVVTKDNDFMESRALHGTPKKLCILRFGNCDNDLLLALVAKHLELLEKSLHLPACVEFGRDLLVVHP